MSVGRVVRSGVARAALVVAVVVGTVAAVPALAAASTTSTSTSAWGAVAALPAPAGVSSISCPSTTTCVAEGIDSNDYGDVEVTTDGGTAWSAGSLPSQVVGGPGAVSCPTTSWCMAVGGGTFVSTDGGKTWSSTTFPTVLEQSGAVACTSVDVCVVAGLAVNGDTTVVTTGDGGSTWSTASLPTVQDDNVQLACPSTTTCELVSSDGTTSQVFSSADGGASWTSVFTGSDFLGSISCPTTTNCLAVGETINSTPTVVSTSNGGASWQTRSPSLTLPYADLTDASCATAASCTVVGFGWPSTAGTNQQPVVASTADGGSSWQQGTLPTTSLFPTAVACPSTSTCIAASAAKAGEDAIITNDGGTSCSAALLSSGDAPLSELSCPTATTCLAAGGTAVATSGDGGVAWSATSVVPGLATISGIACASATACVAVGPSLGAATAVSIEHTTDGGTSWASATLPSGTLGLGAVSCPTSSVCYATYFGSTPGVLLSTDGGATWSALTFPTGSGATGPLACPSASVCYVLAGGGVMATTTSGSMWAQSGVPVATAASIACSTTSDCVVVGSGIVSPATTQSGVVTTTTDGGSTWSSAQSVPSAYTFEAAACPSSTRCLALGPGFGTTSTVVASDALAPGVAVTTTSLPNGEVGVPYGATLDATSGTTPYTWSVPSGSLPNGLALDPTTGAITGTPKTAGTASFSVEVTASGGTTDTASLSITVLPAEPPPTTQVGLPADGATLSSGAWLDASAESPVGIRRVAFVLSGGGMSQPLTIASGVPTEVGWLAAWGSYGVPNGTYTLESVATDDGGQTGTSAPVTVTVDNSPLHTAIVVPAGNDLVLSSGQVLFDATAAGRSPVTAVVFQVSEASGPNSTSLVATLEATATIYGWIAVWSPGTFFGTGPFSVVSAAVDANGNTATSAPLSISLNPPAG